MTPTNDPESVAHRHGVNFAGNEMAVGVAQADLACAAVLGPG